MTLDQIKQYLTDKYALNTTFEIYHVQQWAGKTQEYIKKGLSEEDAGDKAARETFPIGYGKKIAKNIVGIIEIKQHAQSISTLLDAIIEIIGK